ncbi:MAG: hypothetical protein PHE15_00740 [Dehalococcoidales bacterium]|nr:hypothetical protein [Dehalococcoidales bacterium]
MFKNMILESGILFIIGTVSVLILPLQLSCTSLPEKIENINYRTVQIVFVQTKGEETTGTTSIGTGFILNNDGYVITSSYLIDTGEQYIRENESGKMGIVILAPSNVSDNRYSGFVATNDFEVIAVDSEHDLALLKLVMIEMINPSNGKTVYSVHYHNHVNGTLNVGAADFADSIAKNSPIAITGYSSDEFVTETIKGKVTPEEISGIYSTDITSRSDLIGSPVYSTSTCEIIGMCISDSSGETVIIASSYIVDLLENN